MSGEKPKYFCKKRIPGEGFVIRKSIRPQAKSFKYRVGTSSYVNGRWTEDEVEKLVDTIREHGHLNYDEILKALPRKTLDQYKQFLRETRKTVIKTPMPSSQIENCMDWVRICDAQYIKHRAKHGTLELHVLLKLLSIDGVVENHPLPEDSAGVDYAACYRLLCQAILGHPLQPVNSATGSAIFEIMDEMSEMVNQSDHLINTLKEIVSQKFANKTRDVPNSCVPVLHHSDQSERPIKTYIRKNAVDALSNNAAGATGAVKGEELAKAGMSSASKNTASSDFTQSIAVPLKVDSTVQYSTVTANSPMKFEGYAKMNKVEGEVFGKSNNCESAGQVGQPHPVNVSGKISSILEPDSAKVTSLAAINAQTQMQSFASKPTEDIELFAISGNESAMEIADDDNVAPVGFTGIALKVKGVKTDPSGNTAAPFAMGNADLKIERSSEDESGKALSFAAQRDIKVYQKKRPGAVSPLSFCYSETKFLRDVGLNPLLLPETMLYNAAHSFDENLKKATGRTLTLETDGSASKLLEPFERPLYDGRDNPKRPYSKT